MARKGRLLEVMVEHLQRFLSAEGIAVKSPEEFWVDGIKIGEIDITLRGDFGSSTVFVGIECRDRPRSGPQSRDWIREIVGKRDDLKVDKMVAVSTTGFTRPAIEYADKSGIDLLTVQDVDGIDIKGWIETVTVEVRDGDWDICGTVDIRHTSLTPPHYGSGEINLMSSTTGQLVSIRDYIRPEVEKLFVKLASTTSATPEVETTVFIHGPIEATLSGNPCTILSMTVPVRLSVKIIEAKVLLNAFRKPGEDAIIAYTGICQVVTETRKFKVLVIAKKSKLDNKLHDVRFLFLDQDDKPVGLPGVKRLEVAPDFKAISWQTGETSA